MILRVGIITNAKFESSVGLSKIVRASLDLDDDDKIVVLFRDHKLTKRVKKLPKEVVDVSKTSDVDDVIFLSAKITKEYELELNDEVKVLPQFRHFVLKHKRMVASPIPVPQSNEQE